MDRRAIVGATSAFTGPMEFNRIAAGVEPGLAPGRFAFMERIAASSLAFFILLAATACALAQASDPNACAQPHSGGSLSQQLSRSNGVICPPPIDPAIKKPAPSTGSMPVIPPPGTPGGNPNVQPK